MSRRGSSGGAYGRTQSYGRGGGASTGGYGGRDNRPMTAYRGGGGGGARSNGVSTYGGGAGGGGGYGGSRASNGYDPSYGPSGYGGQARAASAMMGGAPNPLSNLMRTMQMLSSPGMGAGGGMGGGYQGPRSMEMPRSNYRSGPPPQHRRAPPPPPQRRRVPIQQRLAPRPKRSGSPATKRKREDEPAEDALIESDDGEKKGPKCHTCDSKVVQENMGDHRKSDKHKQKAMLVERGCRPCGIKAFYNYTQYKDHIALEEHKAKRIAFEEERKKKEEAKKITETKEEDPEEELEKLVEPKLAERGEHDAAAPSGIEHVTPLAGFFCNLCKKFFNNETIAKNSHCKTKGHFEKVLVADQEEFEKATKAFEEKKVELVDKITAKKEAEAAAAEKAEEEAAASQTNDEEAAHVDVTASEPAAEEHEDDDGVEAEGDGGVEVNAEDDADGEDPLEGESVADAESWE